MYRQCICTCTVLDHIVHIHVLLFRNMPDIENLMQEWPSEFEDVLTEVHVFAHNY